MEALPAVETTALEPNTTITIEPKKKKKKYSRGLRDVQKLDHGLSRASRRVTIAVADGLATYIKESRKSAEKSRDGAIRDAFQNWAKAVGKTIRRASTAPEILADTINTKSSRRQFRNAVRMTVPVFFR